MFRELTVIALILAVLTVVILRTRFRRLATGTGERSTSRFPRIEGLAALLCGATTLGLALTGFYDLFVHNRVMHSYVLLVHVGLGGAFTAALTALTFLRAEANTPGVPFPAPYSGTRKLSFWLFAASGLGLILTAALAMIPWLGTAGQVQIIVLHRWVSVVALVAGIIYAGLATKRRIQNGNSSSRVAVNGTAPVASPATPAAAVAVAVKTRGAKRKRSARV